MYVLEVNTNTRLDDQSVSAEAVEGQGLTRHHLIRRYLIFVEENPLSDRRVERLRLLKGEGPARSEDGEGKEKRTGKRRIL